ncbi:unnamed protein product [Mytilus edulis]|uniref:SEA domain-containing protein n=1 Tax=Mytilus edulis TaxID=6550 RepID=A0A8S3VS60_MYTED|nr:unnamed protein product [Mytilus edulis]
MQSTERRTFQTSLREQSFLDLNTKDYLNQNIIVWDPKTIPQPHHGYPASHYYGETQRAGSDQPLHGSISSDSTSETKSRKAIAIAIGIGLLIVVGGAIAVAVYFTSLTDVQRTTVSTIPTTTPVPTQELKFQGNITIDNSWDDDLKNSSSPVYKQKAANVSNMVSTYSRSSTVNK